MTFNRDACQFPVKMEIPKFFMKDEVFFVTDFSNDMSRAH